MARTVVLASAELTKMLRASFAIIVHRDNPGVFPDARQVLITDKHPRDESFKCMYVEGKDAFSGEVYLSEDGSVEGWSKKVVGHKRHKLDNVEEEYAAMRAPK